MEFIPIKGKRRRSLENQLFNSPETRSPTKRPRRLSLPSTPSTNNNNDSRRSLLFEATSAGSKTLHSSKDDESSRNQGRKNTHLTRGCSRLQSRLFQNEGTESTNETATLLLSSQETKDASSRLFQSPEKPSRQSNSTQSTSFFGAVMNNVHHWKSEPPSTPQGFQNTIPAASPGGFNLMNFVNSVTSPFLPKRNGKGIAPSTPMNSGTPTTPHHYGPTTPRHEREWHQTTLSRGEVKWIDWTLKSKLAFECSPGHSLHQCSALTQHKARRQFLAPARLPPLNPQQGSENASTQWQEGLLYWQYPATIYDDASFPEQAVRNGFNPLPPSKLARSSSMPAVAFIKAAQKSTSKTLLQRQTYEKEWQDAFASLYTTWKGCLKGQSEKQGNTDNDLFAEEIAATYFYAQRKEHTVLFRVGISNESKKLGGKVELIPEIVISSTTQEQREMLRSRGVTWKLLERYSSNKNVFVENRSQELIEKENEKKEDISTGLDDDLDALRRAQVYGTTAGADVSISTMSRRSSKLLPTPKLVSPLFLSGFEDCETFYREYLHTIGTLRSEENQKKGANVASNKKSCSRNVPLLLCRKLGPFLNSSLKRLQVDYSNFESESESAEYFDAAEVSGIILPCAVRTLIHAAIRSVESATKPSIRSETSNGSAESIVGMNHLIVQLASQEHSDGRPGKKKDGLPCSSFFNTNSLLWDFIPENESYEVCHAREAVETAVWDVNRAQDVAFKLSKLNAWDFQ